MSISVGPIAPYRDFASHFSWSLFPFHYSPSEWPANTPALSEAQWVFQYYSTERALYIGAETLAPLAPGTKLIVTPYLPRHGMSYIVEPDPETPKHFRLISADNPALCISADGLEENSFVTLSDLRGPNTLLSYVRSEEMCPAHFGSYKFKHSGLFLSLRTRNANEAQPADPLVQDYKTDKSNWRMNHA
jgi:hypothetical protein